MDLTDTTTLVDALAGLTILVGILGVILPVIPGVILCWAGAVGWAIFGEASGGVRWGVAGLATLVALTGTLIKYLWPGKRLKDSGVPTMSLLAGGVLGLVGFFVVPVIGLVLGFVLGIWLAEYGRVGRAQAWPSTRGALGAVGLSLLVEFAAALAIAVIWVFGLVLR